MTSSKKKIFLKTIKNLKDRGSVLFNFEGNTFELSCSIFDYNNERFYMIKKDGDLLGETMSLSKISDKYLTFISYNLFSQKNTFKMSIDKISI
tara:strand:- start:498 stop:776 length:279 start_codon:yes stop_codon:yes gene_type:complete